MPRVAPRSKKHPVYCSSKVHTPFFSHSSHVLLYLYQSSVAIRARCSTIILLSSSNSSSSFPIFQFSNGTIESSSRILLRYLIYLDSCSFFIFSNSFGSRIPFISLSLLSLPLKTRLFLHSRYLRSTRCSQRTANFTFSFRNRKAVCSFFDSVLVKSRYWTKPYTGLDRCRYPIVQTFLSPRKSYIFLLFLRRLN